MTLRIDPHRPVRCRIAPSPTGDPHVGTAYIALFNKIFAEQHNGSFILRIEDTDQGRSTKASEEAIFRSLRWAGLDWQEGPDVGGPKGPYRQSERLEIYQAHADLLLKNGRAYRCFASPEELEEMRRTQKESGRKLPYDRRYRDLSEEEQEKLLKAGRPFVIRMKMPLDGETIVHDALRGDIVFENDGIGDQILLKSDGFPTYHLANVVDDHLMEISHVIRAEEWISSTPKHVELYRAFGWEPPAYVHMPLLRNKDKSKISKRKNPVSLDYYKDVGILPEALLNFLARMGWAMPNEEEKFSYQDLLEHFRFEDMHLGGPVFDLDKLDWLNGLYIRELSEEGLLEKLRAWLFSDASLSGVAGMVKERITRLDQFIEKSSWVFSEPELLPPEDYLPKGKSKEETIEALEGLVERVDNQGSWTQGALEDMLKAFASEIGWKPGQLFPTLRFVATSQKATPSLYHLLEVIGKARIQKRLRSVIEHLKAG